MQTPKKVLMLLALAVMFGSGCVTRMVRPAKPLPADAVPPVISVSSFDNRSNFAGQWNLGAGMSDLLVSELVESQNFTVVDRKEIGRIVGEIERQRNAYFRKEGSVAKGRLKGAHYLVRGVINDFSQVGGASIWFKVKNLMLGGRGYKARVSLTLTIIEIESGQIVDSVQSAAMVRARHAYATGEYEGVRFGGDLFFSTPLGVATVNAIRLGVRGIVEKLPREPWEPMVAEVSFDGNRIIVNGGTDRGVTVGTVFVVQGPGRPVTDPLTGDLLTMIPGAPLGHIRVTEVRPAISYARQVQGGGFQRGHRLVRADSRH